MSDAVSLHAEGGDMLSDAEAAFARGVPRLVPRHAPRILCDLKKYARLHKKTDLCCPPRPAFYATTRQHSKASGLADA